MATTTVTMMKKDAVINLQIGAGFLQKIQHVLSWMASDRKPEELDEFKSLIQKGETEFLEDWMDHLFTLSALVRTLEAEAIKQNATYEQDVNDISNIEG